MKYICQVCGHVYDEEKEKIPFSELPDDWKCPLCGAPKSLFKPESVVEEVKKEPEKAEVTEVRDDFKELSMGQLSIIMSNLARGAEKQYKKEISEDFKKLAGYFDRITPKEKDATAEEITALLLQDVGKYPTAKQTAKEAKDRGALRALTWSEKVSTMVSSIMERYQKEGEDFLKNTSIWICTICGFIYLGDKPPAVCPVCKVPSFKFEKVGD